MKPTRVYALYRGVFYSAPEHGDNQKSEDVLHAHIAKHGVLTQHDWVRVAEYTTVDTPLYLRHFKPHDVVILRHASEPETRDHDFVKVHSAWYLRKKETPTP